MRLWWKEKSIIYLLILRIGYGIETLNHKFDANHKHSGDLEIISLHLDSVWLQQSAWIYSSSDYSRQGPVYDSRGL